VLGALGTFGNLKDCLGLGTETTRASIIEKLKTQKFLEPTEKAKYAVKILPPELIFPDLMAVWENLLSEGSYRRQILIGLLFSSRIFSAYSNRKPTSTLSLTSGKFSFQPSPKILDLSIRLARQHTVNSCVHTSWF